MTSKHTMSGVKPVGYVCDGCGRLARDPIQDLQEIRKRGALSCCPERKMLPVYTYPDSSSDAEPVAWRRELTVTTTTKERLPDDFTDNADLAELWRGHPQTISVKALYDHPDSSSEAVRCDAERYRYLRNVAEGKIGERHLNPPSISDWARNFDPRATYNIWTSYSLKGDDLDREIDAALKSINGEVKK